MAKDREDRIVEKGSLKLPQQTSDRSWQLIASWRVRQFERHAMTNEDDNEDDNDDDTIRTTNRQTMTMTVSMTIFKNNIRINDDHFETRICFETGLEKLENSRLLSHTFRNARRAMKMKTTTKTITMTRQSEQQIDKR